MEKEFIIAILSFIAGITVTATVLHKKLYLSEKERIKLEAKLENSASLPEILQQAINDSINKTNESLITKNINALEPFKKELFEFKQKVEALQNTGIENTALIKEKIETLTKDSSQLRFQAEELSNALKTNAKGRGLFGELILEQILNSAGLINKNSSQDLGNYLTQKSFKDKNENNNKLFYPDAIIFYPEDNKHIIIDSKCPLNDFQSFINESDDALKSRHIKNFYNSVWNMVENLSEKYNNLEGLNLPDFKLLFIPLESAYLYILDNQELILNATKKNVIIVGPSSLLAILKIIKQTWDTKQLSENMNEIKNHSVKLYEKFCIFLDRMEKLQTHFNLVNNDFLNLFTTIKGQDGLITRFEKLKMFGLNPTKQIDEKYIQNDI